MDIANLSTNTQNLRSDTRGYIFDMLHQMMHLSAASANPDIASAISDALASLDQQEGKQPPETCVSGESDDT